MTNQTAKVLSKDNQVTQSWAVPDICIIFPPVRLRQGGSAISETTAKCLLGATKSERYPDLDCSNIKPALKFSWELRRDGQAGGSGSSANTGTVLTREGMTQVAIVAFPAQRNHRYEVILRPERNAENAGIPQPKVQIELDSFVKEDFYIVGAIFDVLGATLCTWTVTTFTRS
jgi:hypothetical protein